MISSGRILFCAKYFQVLDWFLSNKVGPTLELAMHVRVKAKNPFLRIRNKMGQFLSLEVGK